MPNVPSVLMLQTRLPERNWILRGYTSRPVHYLLLAWNGNCAVDRKLGDISTEIYIGVYVAGGIAAVANWANSNLIVSLTFLTLLTENPHRCRSLPVIRRNFFPCTPSPSSSWYLKPKVYNSRRLRRCSSLGSDQNYPVRTSKGADPV
ncbi:hypothetical protein OIU78_003831 [Salix suchowensis]|nr:hypothetical protein OIU78_003831 [Salix suchowensis]